MESVKEIINSTSFLTKEDEALIQRAFDFVQKAHEGQKRLSGEFHLDHLCETAKILADLNMSPTVIVTGLLHDVIEDTEVDEKTLEKEFGQEITFLVNGVTMLGKLKYQGAERHKESLRKFFVAVSQDIRVIIIKLADRLHNMKTLSPLPEEKQKRIARETLEIYVAVAYRLGIRKISRQLEDLAFPYVYPEEYKKTKKLVNFKTEKEFERLGIFEKSVKKALAKNNIINFSTDYRIKTFYSIYKKLIRKEWNIEKIYDIAALRIILPEVKDCYNVLGIIHGIWRPLPDRIKDYIAFPKPNNYQSLHTTIFTGHGNIIEIQIKTKEMHQEAEYGITSHLVYKKETKDSSGSNFSWIKRLLPINKDSSLLEKKLNFDDIPSWIKDLVKYQNTQAEKDLQEDFFKERIFVFTPKGDVIDLPINSTPIDFAYTIHSDIGDHVGGARINGKMTAIDTCLKNGDIIEIVTDKKNSPNQKWLECVKTVNAKRNIRSALQKKNNLHLF